MLIMRSLSIMPLVVSAAMAFSSSSSSSAFLRSRGIAIASASASGNPRAAAAAHPGGHHHYRQRRRRAPSTAVAEAAAESLGNVLPVLASPSSSSGGGKKSLRVVVLGGTGYVGSRVCRKALERGHSVVSVSRRGAPAGNGGGAEADPSSSSSSITYVAGDVTDPATVAAALKDADAVVHAVGLLFDVTTPGGGLLNLIVSGSKSRPGEGSTYDAITRQTAFNAIDALKKRLRLPSFVASAANAVPFAFVSAAEAGWPEVQWGDKIEAVVPDALKRYLAAKRAVEANLMESAKGDPGVFRPILYRPSLIWDWSKLDVLPVIPVFNAAAALGVPFVDRTVRVETLAAAIVAGLEDGSVSGPQRIDAMESLAAALENDDE